MQADNNGNVENMPNLENQGRETRYILGITVRGNLAISCKFNPVFWVIIGLILLVVILFGIGM